MEPDDFHGKACGYILQKARTVKHSIFKKNFAKGSSDRAAFLTENRKPSQRY
jgi:hypothetical protein